MEYSCKTWTIGKTKKRKLKSLKMWSYRRTLIVACTQGKLNDQILEKALLK